MKNNTILIDRIFRTNGTNTYLKNIILILFATLILAVSAKVQVPFWPVPMTMQTFVVFLIGMTYGWRLSFFTLFVYLVEGAVGLPVFASGGGILYLMGPTAGYLYGMLLAASIIGYLSERGFSNSYFMCFLALIVGSVVIFVLGVGYLGSIIGYNKAISAGLMPFIPSELFKIALAVALIPSLSKNFK